MSQQVFGFAFNSAMPDTPRLPTNPPQSWLQPSGLLPPWHRDSFWPVSSSHHRLSRSLAPSRHHGAQRPRFRWRKYSPAWHWGDAACTWDVNKLKHQKTPRPCSLQHPSQELTTPSPDKGQCQNHLYLPFAFNPSLHDVGVCAEHQLAWQCDLQPFFFFCSSPHSIPALLPSLVPSSSMSSQPLLFPQWRYPGNGGLCFSWPGRLDLSGRISCPQTEGAAAAWQSGLTSQAAKPFDTVLFN